MDTKDTSLTQQGDNQNARTDNKGLHDSSTVSGTTAGVKGPTASTDHESAGNQKDFLPASDGTRAGANPSAGGMDRSRGWGQDSRSNNTMGDNNVQTDIPGNKNANSRA